MKRPSEACAWQGPRRPRRFFLWAPVGGPHAARAVKQTFLKLHETAHAVLPHQRKLYAFVEDCEKTLSREVSEQFDRKANVFAADVVFQLDGLLEELARPAARHPRAGAHQ